jgi:hypothetical protein
VARVIRAARSLPGAAPEPVEAPRADEPILLAPKADVAEEYVEAARAEAPTRPQAKPLAQPAPVAPEKPAAALDDFGGLVEPGDEAATSAAMHAREALRQASA